jgi:hypothetical protein
VGAAGIAGKRLRISAMRSSDKGWLRKYGKAPVSLSLEAWWSLLNMVTKPCPSIPACSKMAKPMRSASRSMSREKPNCDCTAAA